MICRPGAGDLQLALSAAGIADARRRRPRRRSGPATRSPGHLVDGVRVTTLLLGPLSDAASPFVQRLFGLVKGGWRADTGLPRRWRSNVARVASDSRPWAGRVLSLRRRAARRHVGRTGSRRPLSRVCVWGGPQSRRWPSDSAVASRWSPTSVEGRIPNVSGANGNAIRSRSSALPAVEGKSIPNCTCPACKSSTTRRRTSATSRTRKLLCRDCGPEANTRAPILSHPPRVRRGGVNLLLISESASIRVTSGSPSIGESSAVIPQESPAVLDLCADRSAHSPARMTHRTPVFMRRG
jgi:hypothetical protein